MYGWVYWSLPSSHIDRVSTLQWDVPDSTPSAPFGFDQKWSIGEIISNIFNAAGLIMNQFITAFQTIEWSFINNIPRWDGWKFVEGGMNDVWWNIWIWTSSPSSLLQIWDAINIGLWGISGSSSTGPDIQFDNTGVIASEDSTRIYVDSDDDSDGSFMVLKWWNTLSDPWTTQLLRVLNNGNVWIATWTPSERLEVNGNIRATGELHADSFCDGSWSNCFSAPIACVGTWQALGYDGTNWVCNTISSTPPVTYANCSLDGQTILHGDSGTFYTATISGFCSAIEQSRTCNDGVLDGSSIYQYASCSAPVVYSDCNLDGTTVNHGDTRDFYSANSSSDCSTVSQSRTCNDGTLDGSTSYQYATCTTPTPFASCTLGWATVNHGDSRPFHTTTSAASCAAVRQTRTCTDGVLSGSSAYQYAFCSSGPSYTYSWDVWSYGACSVSCGGWSRSRSVTCMRSDGTVAADSFCPTPRPFTSQLCNTQTCNIPTNPAVNCTAYPQPPYGSPATRTNSEEVASWYWNKGRCPDPTWYSYWVGQRILDPSLDTWDFWNGMTCSNRFDTMWCNSEILCPAGYEYIALSEFCTPE